MTLDRQMKLSILASIIASIIVVVLIQPALTVVWSALVWISTHLWIGFINGAYRNAALGNRNWVSVGILAIVLAAIIGAITIGLAILRVVLRILAAIDVGSNTPANTAEVTDEPIEGSSEKLEVSSTLPRSSINKPSIGSTFPLRRLRVLWVLMTLISITLALVAASIIVSALSTFS